MDSAVTQTIPTADAPPADYAGYHKSFAACQIAAVPIGEILSRIGSKWTVLVILALSTGPMRFSQMKRTIEGISQKMLTATLRDLEQDGFVTRTVTPIIPPRVDYELTEMGRELRKPLAVIGDWAHRNTARVAEARKKYAAAEAERRERAW